MSSVDLKRKSRHWKLVTNPFPASLHPGSCLGVLIRYNATEKCPRSNELIIKSDDPLNPVKALDLLAYTIWDQCECKDCCDDCRKGCCNRRHIAPCCCQGLAGDCCEEDEDGVEV